MPQPLSNVVLMIEYPCALPLKKLMFWVAPAGKTVATWQQGMNSSEETSMCRLLADRERMLSECNA